MKSFWPFPKEVQVRMLVLIMMSFKNERNVQLLFKVKVTDERQIK